MTDRGVDLSALPKEVRDQLAELDLELSEGDITQKGYEKKRTKLLAPYIIQTPVPPPQNDAQPPAPSSSSHAPAPAPANSSRYRERRSRRTHRNGGTRDDRYRSGKPQVQDLLLTDKCGELEEGRIRKQHKPVESSEMSAAVDLYRVTGGKQDTARVAVTANSLLLNVHFI